MLLDHHAVFIPHGYDCEIVGRTPSPDLATITEALVALTIHASLVRRGLHGAPLMTRRLAIEHQTLVKLAAFAIRRLAYEATDTGLLSLEHATGSRAMPVLPCFLEVPQNVRDRAGATAQLRQSARSDRVAAYAGGVD